MTETPGHQLPTIREGTTLGVRLTVAGWASVIGIITSTIIVIFYFSLWLNAMHTGFEEMRSVQARQQDALDRIETTMREIEFRQKYGIFTSLPPTPKATP